MKSIARKGQMQGLILAVLAVALLVGGALSLHALAADDGEIYLSDIEYVYETHGWGSVMLDLGLNGKSIEIVDTKYAKGVTVHANSYILYDISDIDCDIFSAYIGVNDSESQEIYKTVSSVTFEVLVDGASVYKSGVFRHDTPAEKIEIAISPSAKSLALVTDDAGDGSKADHCAWAEAKLTRTTRAAGNLSGVEFDSNELELARVGDSARPALTATSYGGERIDTSGLSVVYESSDPSIASVSDDGVITMRSKGAAVISATASYEFAGVTTAGVATLTVYGGGGDAPTFSERLCSPSGELEIDLACDVGGRLFFEVSDGGHTVLERSAIGIVTDVCDFSHGLNAVGCDRGELEETYSNISGSFSEVTFSANTMTVTLEKGMFRMLLELRAQDDGFAYRYTLERADGIPISTKIKRESGHFALPADSKIFAEKITSIGAKFNYQDKYSELDESDCLGTYLAFPLLTTSDDEHWMLLTEAELYGDAYVGSALHGIEDGRLELCFAPISSVAASVNTELSFTSPWRCGIVGGLGEVVESTLVEDISERTDCDFSWVKPGVTSWLWLSEGGAASRDFEKLKKYVDLSAEMEWEYILLDAGWQPDAPYGYYDWFDEFMDYADSKGVGVHVWVDCAHLDTPEERAVLRKWANDGIVGVKVDYFDSESPERIALYKEIYEACAEAKLMLNLHGSNKPTGERQAWPHVINREGVLGEEKNDYDPRDLATYAFTRGVIGPMDITPRIVVRGTRRTTAAAQLAMCVHYESGTLTMASFASDYLASPAIEFFRGLPTAWDELRFIDGYPGDFSILARRAGKTWYLSGISAQAVNRSVSLDFLDSSAVYTAYVYMDGATRDELSTFEFDVTSADSLDAVMSAGGGYAVKLVKQADVGDGGEVGRPPQSSAPITPPTDDGGDGRALLWCLVGIGTAAAASAVTVFVVRRKKK